MILLDELIKTLVRYREIIGGDSEVKILDYDPTRSIDMIDVESVLVQIDKDKGPLVCISNADYDNLHHIHMSGYTKRIEFFPPKGKN